MGVQYFIIEKGNIDTGSLDFIPEPTKSLFLSSITEKISGLKNGTKIYIKMNLIKGGGYSSNMYLRKDLGIIDKLKFLGLKKAVFGKEK